MPFFCFSSLHYLLQHGLADLILYNGTTDVPPAVTLTSFVPPIVLNKPSVLSFAPERVDCRLSVGISDGGTSVTDKTYSLQCRSLFACGNTVADGPEQECFISGDACPNYDVASIPKCPATGQDTYVPLYFVAISDMVASSSSALAGVFDIGMSFFVFPPIIIYQVLWPCT